MTMILRPDVGLGCDPGDHESTELKAHNKHIETSQTTQKQTPSNQSLVARKAPAS